MDRTSLNARQLTAPDVFNVFNLKAFLLNTCLVATHSYNHTTIKTFDWSQSNINAKEHEVRR